MESLRIADWTLHVDVDATREVYREIAASGGTPCACLFDENYRAAAAHHFPRVVHELFERLGIDGRFPADGGMEWFDGGFDRPVQYVGAFGFVGQLVDGPDLCRLGDRSDRAPELPSSKARQCTRIHARAAVGFASEDHVVQAPFFLLPEEHAPPALLELHVELPWVLPSDRKAEQAS